MQKSEQMNIFNFIEDERSFKTLKSSVKQDAITKRIEENFDYEIKNGGVEENIEIPSFPKDFEIGLIVGSSGSGKSTIMKEVFGEEEQIEWDNQKCIASHFEDFEEASNRFGAVGLNSIPTWLKPYCVLSNGEKFRADMSRKLKDNAVIDEFTSVVNRECAISCSTSIEKYIRKNGIKNVVFCSCHDDIIPYLKPNWVYNTDTHEFYDGRYLRRKKIDIKINACRKETWDMFKRHHYLSGDLNKSASCYIATMNDIPIGFISIISFPNGCLKHAFREHRVVILPDYQGMGIGNKLSEAMGQTYRECGCRYFTKTSNPRMGIHRDNSSKWKPTAHNHSDRKEYYNKDGSLKTNKYSMSEEKMKFHSKRVCYCHEYIGDGTEYPFTYGVEKAEIKETQMTIFDYL